MMKLMPQLPVLVSGYALVDLVPHPHETGTYHAALGGSPFNVALALGRLGVPTAFVGCLSEDSHGERLAAALRAAGINCDAVLRCVAPTPLACVAPGTEVSGPRYSFYLKGTAFEEHAPLPSDWRSALHLHVGSTSALVGGSADEALAALEVARGAISTSFDPNIRPPLLPAHDTVVGRVEALVARASIVKASTEDLGWLYPGCDPAATAARWAEQGPGLVVLTRGAAGAVAFSGRVSTSAAAPAVDVVDTVGAGDAFMAALLAFLHDAGVLSAAPLALSPDTMAGCLGFATAAASLCCTRPGADAPSRAEVENLVG
jgi:fructokinase